MKKVKKSFLFIIVLNLAFLSGCSLMSNEPASAEKKSGDNSSIVRASAGKSTISGLPYQAISNVSKPNGTPGGLTILNWAGFKAAVTYTFDDGQPSQIQHYAELQAEGVPVTFYICANQSNSQTNFNSTWIQAVKDGHEIGNHTMNHVNANGIPAPNTPLNEIDMDTAYITSHFGQSGVWTMASPYGDTGWEQYASQRFFLMRGVWGGTIAPNDSTDPFNLLIYGAAGGESLTTLNTKIDSGRTNGNWLIFMFHSLLPGANWYAGVDCTNVTGSMEHAKSLGDVWVDSVMKVGAYWRGQKVLSAVTPVQSGNNILWSWTLPDHFPAGMYLRITVTGGTVVQNGKALNWDTHGFYEISLDAGSLTIQGTSASSQSSSASSISSSRSSAVSSAASSSRSSAASSIASSASSSRASSATSSAASSTASSSASSAAYILKTAPFSFDGTGEFYWSMTNIPNYVNSWNTGTLTINGTSFLNTYAGASQLPAKQNGYYYIHYAGLYAWSHFEAK